MLKIINKTLIEIELQKYKTLWDKFLLFIEKGIALWYKNWVYNPKWDKIGTYKVKENYYIKRLLIANKFDY